MKDDAPFTHYTPKQRLIRWVSRNLFDHVTYTVRRGPLKGMKRRGGLAWLPESGSAMAASKEQVFLNGLDLAGKTIYDVGAFEGLFTMFFARSAGHVVCFEPNSRNFERLKQNLALNRLENITVRKTALGATARTAQMVWDPSMAGGATLTDTGMASSMRQGNESRVEEIQINTLDLDRSQAGLPLPDFIKIDVEGYELPVLEGARELLSAHHPALFIEIHGETMNEKRRNVEAVVSFLCGIGYGSIVHVESGGRVTPGDSAQAAQGHLYAKAS